MAITFNEKGIALGACILYAIIIFIGSSIPGGDVPKLYFSNYHLHFVVFFFFGILLLWWRTATRAQAPATAIVQAVVIGSIYGIFDEFHQHFTPGRTVDAFDWLADTSGALAGVLSAMFFLFLQKKYGPTKGTQQDI